MNSECFGWIAHSIRRCTIPATTASFQARSLRMAIRWTCWSWWTSRVFQECLIAVRPVGMLEMVDQDEPDQKVLAVPNRNPRFDQIHTIDQVFPHNLREIEHFFKIYKELEEKRTEMRGWRGPRETRDLIRLFRDRYLAKRDEAAAAHK